MLDLSFWEIAVVAVACILFLKPEDLPEILRALGKFFRKIRNTIDEYKNLLEIESDQSEVKPKNRILGLDGKYHDDYNVDEVFTEKKPDEPDREKTAD